MVKMGKAMRQLMEDMLAHTAHGRTDDSFEVFRTQEIYGKAVVTRCINHGWIENRGQRLYLTPAGIDAVWEH